jgi:hypothetical protein
VVALVGVLSRLVGLLHGLLALGFERQERVTDADSVAGIDPNGPDASRTRRGELERGLVRLDDEHVLSLSDLVSFGNEDLQHLCLVNAFTRILKPEHRVFHGWTQ